MKQTIERIWRLGRGWVSAWRTPEGRASAAPASEVDDWAHASAAGEEDPGASVELLDARLPAPVKEDGAPRG